MKLTQRPYQPGDEDRINQLYNRITGRGRSDAQYRWEWLETWKGPGSIWLGFDTERDKDDQLVLQYSLIPIPMSVWGEPFLAGKTENCMAHPVCRGTGVFYRHENKYFDEAKKQYQIFFTTAGEVTKGAVGAVRRKLGYQAFDGWVSLFFMIKGDRAARNAAGDPGDSTSRREGLFKKTARAVLPYYFSFFIPKRTDPRVTILEQDGAPLDQIQDLWEQNKQAYGVTIQRTRPYLDWRINRNPYFKHKYLIFEQDDRLKGYIIFYQTKGAIIRVADIFAEKKDKRVFKQMIKSLVRYAASNRVEQILCVTSSGNRFLRNIFMGCGFLRTVDFRLLLSRTTEKNLSIKRPFHVFAAKEVLEKYPRIYQPRDWYMTELIFEGVEI